MDVKLCDQCEIVITNGDRWFEISVKDSDLSHLKQDVDLCVDCFDKAAPLIGVVKTHSGEMK